MTGSVIDQILTLCLVNSYAKTEKIRVNGMLNTDIK